MGGVWVRAYGKQEMYMQYTGETPATSSMFTPFPLYIRSCLTWVNGQGIQDHA